MREGARGDQSTSPIMTRTLVCLYRSELDMRPWSCGLVPAGKSWLREPPRSLVDLVGEVADLPGILVAGIAAPQRTHNPPNLE